MAGTLRASIFIFLGAIWVFTPFALSDENGWKNWDKFPQVPKITANQVKMLMLSGEKVVFVYAGYEVEEVVCGSFSIPYNLVPPYADGSKVRIKIPKDYWVMCYCP